MKWFLDMNIILYYAGADGISEFTKKTNKFVQTKGKQKFLVCYYILVKDLPNWLERQKIIINELKKKINNPNYTVGSSQEGKRLWPRDLNKAKKLLINIQNNKEEFIQDIINVNYLLERKINLFIEQKIDEKVIPIKDIDIELRSNLLDFIDKNISDASVISSAIQYHNIDPIYIMTSDKEHFNKENIRWAIPIASDLSKKYPKIPEIKYIQDF